MDSNHYLLMGFILAILLILYLIAKLCQIRRQVSLIKDVLKDVKAGNLNRRILARENDMTKEICYDINQIAIDSQSQLIRQKQSEQAYKRLMTSLSHDVKTPLASLTGYLEAVESQVVTGAEKEEYIHVAFEKSRHLKSFVEHLFEWVKLDSGEQIFHFEELDINEVTRDLMADWIPALESGGFDYEIDMPDTESRVRLDKNAYARMINNILQNMMIHSGGDQMTLQILEEGQQVQVRITDNGKGISQEDLSHIFERLYQCDGSRLTEGNGLGLAITKELVQIHHGTITANSIPGIQTEFLISFPRAL